MITNTTITLISAMIVFAGIIGLFFGLHPLAFAGLWLCAFIVLLQRDPS